MSKVNLTVHKNTMEQRKRKTIRDNLAEDAFVMSRNSCVSKKLNGYAIIVWDDDGISDACWMRGNIPTQLIGEHFKQTMARKLGAMDAKDIVRSEVYGE